VSDDGVLQIGDWHHLKISVKLAADTNASDSHHVLYRVEADHNTWALSVNTTGNSPVIADFPG